MPQIAAGADSALLTRPGLQSDFKANLGVVVTVEDYENFLNIYPKIVAKACGDQQMPWARPLCCAADLRYFSGNDEKTITIIEEILNETAEQVKQVHVVYTMIFPSRIDKVYIYNEESPVVRLSPVEFQDRLQNAYAYLSLWAYSKCIPGLKRPLVTDNFAGEKTQAWKELVNQCPPRIYFDGANTNALVSLADLIVRLLDRRFEQTREKLVDVLTKERVPMFLSELDGKVQPFYLGQRYLREVAPLSREQINVSPLIAHPIIFVIKEPTSIQTSDFISRTSVMDLIYKAAVKVGGCVKFFEPRAALDQALIQTGDYFLWTGEHGKRFVESLPSLGYKGLHMCEASEIGNMTV